MSESGAMKLKFQAFHPYLTYTSEGNSFIDPKGAPSFDGWPSVSHPTDMSSDALDLWRLGKRAFESLSEKGEIKSKDDFDDLFKYFHETIHGIRLALAERIMTHPNSIDFVNLDGEHFIPDLDELSNSSIIDIAWQAARAQSGDCLIFGELFLFVCWEEIDSAIIGMCLDGSYAVSGALSAAEAYANFQAIESGNDNLQKVRSEFAARAAIERHKRDPKQTAKTFIKECWGQWQENPTLYRTQSIFANDVLTKIQTSDNGDPIISFDTIVKKWIPAWTKARK